MIKLNLQIVHSQVMEVCFTFKKVDMGKTLDTSEIGEYQKHSKV